MKKFILAVCVMLAASSAAQGEWVVVTRAGTYTGLYDGGSVSALGRGWYKGTYGLVDTSTQEAFICNARFTTDSFIDDECQSRNGGRFDGTRKEIVPNSILEAIVRAMIKSVSY